MKTHKVEIIKKTVDPIESTIRIPEADLLDIVLVDKEHYNPIGGNAGVKIGNKINTIQVRAQGEFNGKGLYLQDSYNWVITRDLFGQLVLVPYKKHSI